MRLITLLGCLLFSSVLVVNGVSLRTDKSGMLLESSRFRILGKSIATSRDNRFDFFLSLVSKSPFEYTSESMAFTNTQAA